MRQRRLKRNTDRERGIGGLPKTGNKGSGHREHGDSDECEAPHAWGSIARVETATFEASGSPDEVGRSELIDAGEGL